MGRKHTIILIAIVALVVFCVCALSMENIFGRNGMTLGLDLRGGVYLEYQAEFGNESALDNAGRLEETKNIIERRINAWGVTEAEIYITGSDRIVIQLPGFKNIDDAKQLVGKTAVLSFYEQATAMNTSLTASVNVSDTVVSVASVSGFGQGDIFGIENRRIFHL